MFEEVVAVGGVVESDGVIVGDVCRVGPVGVYGDRCAGGDDEFDAFPGVRQRVLGGVVEDCGVDDFLPVFCEAVFAAV